MSKIKYRVWGEATKKMYYPVKGCDLMIRIDGSLFVHIDNVEGGGLIPAKGMKLILMQSLGIKDMGKRKVYKSDIVKVKGIDDLFVVAWDNGMLGYNLLPTRGRGRKPLNKLIPSLKIRVVGNIYENPELIRPSTPNE